MELGISTDGGGGEERKKEKCIKSIYEIRLDTKPDYLGSKVPPLFALSMQKDPVSKSHIEGKAGYILRKIEFI